MATLPYGAAPADTGEYMVGRIAVTPILLESNGKIDPNTEDWTQTHIQEVLSNLNAGLQFWDDLLATKTSVHSLDFVIDDQYAVNPVPSAYEAINRPSNDYVLWVSEFLNRIGYNQSTNLETNIRAFNNAQRIKYNADWAYSVFVVDSKNDVEGTFAPGGNFSRAFAFAGGLFFVTPSTRPASTFAHETGHMFWARDEYAGGGNYLQRRGYYNTQNLNAIDLNVPNFVQATSIMSAGTTMQNAYDQRVSPPSTLAMIGWQDTDSDGIFDVLDVPLQLDGVGRFDSVAGEYRFKGKAKVGTLINLNTSGLQNDITLNRVSRIEYRVNNGAWTTIVSPDSYEADLDFAVPVSKPAIGTIEIRAIDNATKLTSNIYQGTFNSLPDSTIMAGINGFVWSDLDSNGNFDTAESGQANWTVRLIDNAGQALALQKRIEPDDRPEGPLSSNAYPGVTLSSVGQDTDGQLGILVDGQASTGNKVFQPYSLSTNGFTAAWHGQDQYLRVDFGNATNFVSVDVIGYGADSYGRLEVYSSAGKLLDRTTSSALASGQAQTLSIGRNQSDIGYAIIRGHMDTSVKIDNLRYGPASQVTTDAQGRYSFGNLPAGTYKVQVIAPSSAYTFTSPNTGVQTVSLAAGQSVAHTDFGAHFEGSPWHNSKLSVDVNDNGTVTPLDALLIINLLNLKGSSALDGSGIPNTPYIDVTNDRFVTPLDALQVINYLNLNGTGGEGETGLGSRGSGSGNGSGSSGIGSSGQSGGSPDGEGAPLVETAASKQIEIIPVYNRYADLVGPALADNAFMERLSSPQWTTPEPCHCPYCMGLETD